MRKKGVGPLVAFVGIVVLLFSGTLVARNKANLGLDLQGGVSVVLQPVKEGKKQTSVSKEALEQTKQIIDTRVNAIGVGEPDITVQGATVVVQLPGIKDQQRVLDLVGKTAELRFRPLLDNPKPAPPADAEDQIKKLRAQFKIPDKVTAEQIYTDEHKNDPPPATASTSVTPGSTPATTPATVAPATTAAASTVPPGAGTGGGRSLKGRVQAPTTTTTAATTTTSAKSGSTTTTAKTGGSTTTTTIKATPKNQWGVDTTDPAFLRLGTLEAEVAQSKIELTPPEKDDRDKEVVLLGRPGKGGARERYKLGPTLLTGTAIEDAQATISGGQWIVNPKFKDGKNGIDLFNAAAAKCFSGDPAICPTKRLAVVLDGVVVSGPPTIQAASFARDSIQISGSFKEQDARDLALALRYGSLPLTLEPQQVQTVSATLGSGALHAGLLAGIIGLALVCAYIVFYYRLLGLMTVCELCLTAMTLWVIIAYFGEHQGLTLTLAGIVGIVVSIGVSLDSSVVYFENLKENVRGGRQMRSTVDRSFDHAFKTIVKADLSSLIGAIILYTLSVGPVRGFAFYLGLSTLIDLATSYFFMRNATALLAKSKLGSRPGIFGIPLGSSLRSEPDAAPAVAVATNEGGAIS